LKRKILIIGSYGYIGKKLKKELNKKFNLIIPNKKKLDITKINDLKSYIRDDIHCIINLSGQIDNNHKLMKKIIIDGNKNIIKLCDNKKIKVYFISTSLVYGYSVDKKRENSKKTPLDNYSKYKLKAEKHYIFSKANYTILRLCNIYNGKKKGLIKNISNYIYNNKKIFLTNSNAYRNYIYLDDLVNIISEMLDTKLKHRIYNIGFENIKLFDIFKQLNKKLKICINYIDQKKSLKKIPSQIISNTRIFKEINYRPKVKIQNYLIKKYHDLYQFSKK
jgi:dTDP-4-dehydrorhamnose reductase